MRTTLIAILCTAGLVGGGAFYGGMQYERTRQPLPTERGARTNTSDGSARRMFAGGFTGNGGRGTGGSGGGGEVVAGEILEKNDTRLTVKLRDGGSRIVFLSATTPVAKTTAGSMKDLAPGITIFVNGSANPDGSFAAQSIQIRPTTRAGAPTP